MQFIDTVEQVLKESSEPLSPAQIRDIIKEKYPDLYGTSKHQALVDRGSCTNLDHALKLQVYNQVGNTRFICDRSSRPMKLSLSNIHMPEEDYDESELISEEAIENNIGSLYILKTGTYTREGKEILKIGITSGDIQKRINQLYTTGVPNKFTVHAIYKLSGFMDLERALHAIFSMYRVNSSREFFTDEVLLHIDEVIDLYRKINLL